MSSRPMSTRIRDIDRSDEDSIRKSLKERVAEAIEIGLKVAANIKLKMATKERGAVNPGMYIQQYKKRKSGTIKQAALRTGSKAIRGRGSVPATPKKVKMPRVRAGKITAIPKTIRIKPKTVMMENGRKMMISEPIPE